MNRYLRHHGIKGQKWGEKNGPPYPLDASTHKRVVKKDKRTKGLRLKLALAAVSSVIIADQIGVFEKARRKIADKLDPKTSRSKNDLDSIRKKGKSFKEIDDKLIATINGKNHFKHTRGGQINCLSCSLAYVSDTVAYEQGNPIYGADGGYFANASDDDEKAGIHNVLNNINTIFDIERDNGLTFKEASQKIEKNTTGMLFVNGDDIFTYGGHAVNYECDSKGNITIVDSQAGEKYSYKDFQKLAEKNDMNKVCAIFDCTNTSLNKESKILPKIFR